MLLWAYPYPIDKYIEIKYLFIINNYNFKLYNNEYHKDINNIIRIVYK